MIMAISISNSSQRARSMSRLMLFDPFTGEEMATQMDPGVWRLTQGRAWLFNPWSGMRRDGEAVAQDPFGLEMSPPPPSEEDKLMGQWLTAARNNDVKTARLILAANPSLDVDSPLTDLRNSALGIALYHGNVEIGEFLIKREASTRYQNVGGSCILQMAARSLNGLTMLLSTEAKGDVNYQDDRRCTPLMEATNIADGSPFGLPKHEWAGERAKCVALLVKHGANLDHQNCEGRTALMSAAYMNSEPLVKTLIHAGARTDIRSSCGWRAIDYASDPLIKKILARSALHIVQMN